VLRRSRLVGAAVISVVDSIAVAIRAPLKLAGGIRASIDTIGDAIAVPVGAAVKGRQAGLVGTIVSIVRHAIPILVG